VSGDIPVETKKIETEAKPLLLSGSVSTEIYLPQEAHKKPATVENGGLTGFVQEMYVKPTVENKKPEAVLVDPRTANAKESDRKFADIIEKASLKDLKHIAATQTKVLDNLHDWMDKVGNDPEKRKESARIAELSLTTVLSRLSAIDANISARNEAAKAKIQKDLETGKADLGSIPAKLKFETKEGTFDVESSKKRLTFSSDEGKVSYYVKDGMIIENKDGATREVGPSDKRESYVYKDGQLQKVDSSQVCGDGTGSPVFELGGGKKSLKTSISTGDANVAVEKTGIMKKFESLHNDNKVSVSQLQAKIKAANEGLEAPPPRENKGKGCGDGTGWPGGYGKPREPGKVGDGRGEPVDSGRGGGGHGGGVAGGAQEQKEPRSRIEVLRHQARQLQPALFVGKAKPAQRRLTVL